jgi:hypothetical protein
MRHRIGQNRKCLLPCKPSDVHVPDAEQDRPRSEPPRLAAAVVRGFRGAAGHEPAGKHRLDHQTILRCEVVSLVEAHAKPSTVLEQQLQRFRLGARTSLCGGHHLQAHLCGRSGGALGMEPPR